ncbi:hypothetical protein XH98_30605 [Bradyrhizobium sp. CCBAU 51745]|nr:hypothetical protein [Bradyrhizobium sp. CCBAU 51745]
MEEEPFASRQGDFVQALTRLFKMLRLCTKSAKQERESTGPLIFTYALDPAAKRVKRLFTDDQH